MLVRFAANQDKYRVVEQRSDNFQREQVRRSPFLCPALFESLICEPDCFSDYLVEQKRYSSLKTRYSVLVENLLVSER